MKTKQLFTLALIIVGLILGGPLSAQDWRDILLRDVISGESFRISDFEGQTVLLESFAVWCPTCTKQQEEVRKLHEQIGDGVISISLDVDPICFTSYFLPWESPFLCFSSPCYQPR